MTTADVPEPRHTSGKTPNADYVVGKYRPPVETRWQPGQSGNPKGRPKGRRNWRKEIEELLAKQVTIRDGDAAKKLSLLAANIFSHAIKGAKGDARSTALFLNFIKPLLDCGDTDVGRTPCRNQHECAVTAADKSSPSNSLLNGIDLDRLSKEEQLELARLADVIDRDVTALNVGDFEQFKFIVEKGRGKHVKPH